MKIAIDSCSVILLAKATVLEVLANNYELFMTEKVYKEVLEGKNKKFIDALLTEKLVKEKSLKINKVKNNKLTKKVMEDFNIGIGEAETLALIMEKQCEAIITDNKQGRKSAVIYGLNLAGSIDVIIALHTLNLIDNDKAKISLKKLREFGWFQDYLIDKAMEEIEDV